jgi:hypothetical protein
VFGQAVARLQQGTSAAATTLLKMLIDPGTPASVEVRAAEAIFNHAATIRPLARTNAAASARTYPAVLRKCRQRALFVKSI